MLTRRGAPAPKGRSRSSWFVFAWTLVLLGGLLVASVWDADGNPRTDNLPAVTLTTETPSCDHEHVAASSSHPATERAVPRRRRILSAALSRLTRPQRWRPLAVPARGP